MRGYYAVVVAAMTLVVIGVSASQIPGKAFVKEPKCPSSGAVRLPHPKYCTQYYICQDGKGVIHRCPDGLHFNNVIQHCDWPPAGCVELDQPETQPLEPENEEEANGCIGTCPIPDPMDRTIHLPYGGDCSKFCKCSNGIPFIMDCPPGLHFDKAESVCNWPWAAHCQQ